MPYGWEGNRRSGVALAMRHRLLWFIHLRAHGLKREDEHPAYTHYVLLLDPCPFPLPKKSGNTLRGFCPRALRSLVTPLRQLLQ